MDFKALFTQLSVVFTKLTKQQRIIITAAIVGIVSFLIFLVVVYPRYPERIEEVKPETKVDFFDSFGSNIKIDVRGTKVMRILPRVNAKLNED